MTAFINWAQRASSSHQEKRETLLGHRVTRTQGPPHQLRLVVDTREQMQAFLQQFNKDFIQYNKRKAFLYFINTISLLSSLTF